MTPLQVDIAMPMLALGFICLVVGLGLGWMMRGRPMPGMPADPEFDPLPNTKHQADLKRDENLRRAGNGERVSLEDQFAGMSFPQRIGTPVQCKIENAVGMPADSLGEPPTIQEMSGFLPGDADIFEERQEPQRAENPVQRKTETAVFYSDGYPLPVRKAWGDVAYDELSPMFLDQFLLRYDHALMADHQEFVLGLCHYPSPWEGFTAYCPWAKERPLLFEQLTGYKLNELQLNNAIAEYVRRLQKQEAKSNG